MFCVLDEDGLVIIYSASKVYQGTRQVGGCVAVLAANRQVGWRGRGQPYMTCITVSEQSG